MTSWVTRSKVTAPAPPNRAIQAHLTNVLDVPVPPFHAVDPERDVVACSRVTVHELRVSDDEPWSPYPDNPDWCPECIAEVARRVDDGP